MTASPANRAVPRYLELAIAGEHRRAVRLVLELLEEQVPVARIITDLLGAAQREVGERWQRGEWSTADEHLVTGVSRAALEALATTAPAVEAQGLVVAACAEGDWHGLPSRMFAEELRVKGQGVLALGASTPATDLTLLISRRRPDALAVTSNLALSYLGAVRLIDAAHRQGVPVIAGGAALDATRAIALGADAWAADAATAADIFATWRDEPPAVSGDPVALDAGVLALDAEAPNLAGVALADLERRFPPLADYDERQRRHTREDLGYIVRYVAASRMVDDPTVFSAFLVWLTDLLVARGVPVQALHAGLASLAPLVGDLDEDGHGLLEAALTSAR